MNLIRYQPNQIHEFRAAATSGKISNLVRFANQVRSKLPPMWTWIVIGFCYVLVIGGFRILGGVGAAADALRDWGRASSNGAHQPRPSS
jgi:hypothetical protein